MSSKEEVKQKTYKLVEAFRVLDTEKIKDILSIGKEILRRDLFIDVQIRQGYISLAGFILYGREYIESLSKFIGNRKCLEVCAGYGALTCHLKKFGVDIIATGLYKETYGFNMEEDTDRTDFRNNSWIIHSGFDWIR